MEKWTEIRRKVLVEGVSKRQVQRETGLSWKTLEKILGYSSPPSYRRTKPYEKPKIGPFLDRVSQIIEADRDAQGRLNEYEEKWIENVAEGRHKVYRWVGAGEPELFG